MHFFAFTVGEKPVECWSLEKFGDGNACAADEEVGIGVVGFMEGGDVSQLDFLTVSGKA